MANVDPKDAKRGIYGKFQVRRVDGSSKEGGRHEGCDYYVLDWEHDPHAIPAMKAYADSCEADYPVLASDIRLRIVKHEKSEELISELKRRGKRK